jgi:hypothetical protein
MLDSVDLVEALPIASFTVAFTVSAAVRLQQWDSIHNPLYHSQPVRCSAGRQSLPPTPPVEAACRTCQGQRKVTCPTCAGWGRLNHQGQLVLPKGQSPRWCQACRGTGLDTCQRCLGTGLRPPSVGFRV